MPYPYIKCNYNKTIQAVLKVAKDLQEALHDIDSPSYKEFAVKLETTIQYLASVVSSDNTQVHIDIIKNAPLTIKTFSSALEAYLTTIVDDDAIEIHRKRLLGILKNIHTQQPTAIIFDPSEPIDTYLDWEIKSKLKYHDFNFLFYVLQNGLEQLTKQQRVDEVCFFTEEAIPEHRAVNLSNGQKLDILPLLRWQWKRDLRPGETNNNYKIINPLSNVPAAPDELATIRNVAMKCKVKLSSDRQLLWQNCEAFSEREQIDEYCKKMDYASLQTMLINSEGTVKAPMLAFRALCNAVRTNKIELARFLLDLNISPNYPAGYTQDYVADSQYTVYYLTPIFWAVKPNNRAMIELLIQHHADINAFLPVYPSSNFHLSAFRVAVSSENDDRDLVKFLLEKAGANPNQLFEDNQSALYLAVGHGNIQIATMLIAAGAKINNSDDQEHGRSILHHAVSSGKLELVKLVLEHGANLFDKVVYEEDKPAVTTIEFARKLKRTDIIDFLEGMIKYKTSDESSLSSSNSSLSSSSSSSSSASSLVSSMSSSGLISQLPLDLRLKPLEHYVSGKNTYSTIAASLLRLLTNRLAEIDQAEPPEARVLLEGVSKMMYAAKQAVTNELSENQNYVSVLNPKNGS